MAVTMPRLALHHACRYLRWRPNSCCPITASLIPQHRQMSQGPKVPTMESFVQANTDAKHIPGAVLLATDRDGGFEYSSAFGVRSLRDNTPLTPDTIMWIASCTKLLTSIAAMQCIERGLLTLDQDLRPLLHELDDIDIIGSNPDGEILTMTKNESPITMRHTLRPLARQGSGTDAVHRQLLTHSSGFAYEFNSPTLQRWRTQQPSTPAPNSVHNRFLHPLLYEPGTSWSYGPSIDWAGVAIERATSSISLQSYMESEIWARLGITDMTFFLSQRPDLHDRLSHMSRRDGDAAQVEHATAPQPCLERDGLDCQGGGGIFASPKAYLPVLRALLRDGTAVDGEKGVLLARATVDQMFAPQLGPGCGAALGEVADVPRFNHMMGNMPPGTALDHALGGLSVREDLEGWRRKGTMTWGGTPNLTWWIDRSAGLCGLYASQVMPIGDPKSNEMVHAFEKAMYERHADFKSGKRCET